MDQDQVSTALQHKDDKSDQLQVGASFEQEFVHSTQIVCQHLKTACPQPALGLIAYRMPWRQVMRQRASRRAVLHRIPQPTQDFAQLLDALPDIFRQQCRMGRDQRPFFIRKIRGVRLETWFLTKNWEPVHNKL